MSDAAASLPASYFDGVYRASDDPWQFETSAYEAAKYADSVAALEGRRFASGFEIGCSIGVLSALLAPQCGRLLSVDAAEAPLARARERCRAWPGVSFARMQVPAEFPPGPFDLIVMSEVGYYWARPDLDSALEKSEDALDPGGLLLLVHWTPFVADYPLRGDDVHEAALARAGASGRLAHHRGERQESYRLDVFTRR